METPKYYKLILGQKCFNHLLTTLEKSENSEYNSQVVDFLCAVEKANLSAADAQKQYESLDNISKSLEV